MISSFGNAVLSREQMNKETGGVDRYWAYNDNADSIAYMTAEAAHNHCMSSIRCTSCRQFNIPWFRILFGLSQCLRGDIPNKYSVFSGVL